MTPTDHDEPMLRKYVKTFYEKRRYTRSAEGGFEPLSPAESFDEQVKAWVDETGNVITEIFPSMSNYIEDGELAVTLVTYAVTYFSQEDFLVFSRYTRIPPAYVASSDQGTEDGEWLRSMRLKKELEAIPSTTQSQSRSSPNPPLVVENQTPPVPNPD